MNRAATEFEENDRVRVARIVEDWGDPFGMKGKKGRVLRISGEWSDVVLDGDDDRDYVCCRLDELEKETVR